MSSIQLKNDLLYIILKDKEIGIALPIVINTASLPAFFEILYHANPGTHNKVRMHNGNMIDLVQHGSAFITSRYTGRDWIMPSVLSAPIQAFFEANHLHLLSLVEKTPEFIAVEKAFKKSPIKADKTHLTSIIWNALCAIERWPWDNQTILERLDELSENDQLNSIFRSAKKTAIIGRHGLQETA